MSWIELHQSLPQHPKLIRLAARLGVDRFKAMGHLSTLWLWALEYAQEGNLQGFGAVEIAAAAGWTEDAEAFLLALRECKWMDKNRLHDWMDYAGRLVEKRTANRERMRAKRAGSVRDTTGPRTGATVPNRTVPNHNLPHTPSGGLQLEFEKARKAWPGTRRQFSPEWKAFERKHGERAEEIVPLLLPAIARYRAHVEKRAAADKKPPFWQNFKTWIAQEGWTAEYPGESVDVNGKEKATAFYREHGFYPRGTPSDWMGA